MKQCYPTTPRAYARVLVEICIILYHFLSSIRTIATHPRSVSMRSPAVLSQQITCKIFTGFLRVKCKQMSGFVRL